MIQAVAKSWQQLFYSLKELKSTDKKRRCFYFATALFGLLNLFNTFNFRNMLFNETFNPVFDGHR